MYLHCTVNGAEDAPPLVFLHGFMGNTGDWDPIVHELREDFRCICFDLPGHGRSASARGDMAQTCDAIVGQLAARDIRRFGLTGYSMGGRIALYLALHYPGQVERLLLESASPGIRSHGERLHRASADAALARRLDAMGMADGSGFEAFVKAWYAKPLWTSLQERPALLERVMQRRRQNEPAALAQALRTLGVGEQPSLWDELARYTAPVRCVVGAHDAKYCRIAQEMRVWAPPVSVVTVPDSGHDVHLETPGEYVRHVRDFFSQ